MVQGNVDNNRRENRIPIGSLLRVVGEWHYIRKWFASLAIRPSATWSDHPRALILKATLIRLVTLRVHQPLTTVYCRSVTDIYIPPPLTWSASFVTPTRQWKNFVIKNFDLREKLGTTCMCCDPNWNYYSNLEAVLTNNFWIGFLQINTLTTWNVWSLREWHREILATLWFEWKKIGSEEFSTTWR